MLLFPSPQVSTPASRTLSPWVGVSAAPLCPWEEGCVAPLCPQGSSSPTCRRCRFRRSARTRRSARQTRVFRPAPVRPDHVWIVPAGSPRVQHCLQPDLHAAFRQLSLLCTDAGADTQPSPDLTARSGEILRRTVCVFVCV